MLTGGQSRGRLGEVQVIRRGDVDDINARVAQHRLEALVCRRQVQRGSSLGGSRMTGSNDSVNLHAKAAQGLDVHHADEAGSDDGGANFADGPRSHRFLAEPRSAGVSEPQAATILPSSLARDLASAGSAKRMKRALGCDPSRCGNLPGIRAPRLNMTEVCFLSLTCTMVAKSPPS